MQALPREVQFHPVTDVIEHVDFQQVSDSQPVRVAVPVKVMNQDRSIGVKRGGVVNVVRHEIELMCRPSAIPQRIEIDIVNLNIGGSIHIEDVQLPDGVTPTIRRNFTVITIAGRAKAEEEAPAAAAAAPAADAKAPAKKEDKK